LSQIRFEYEISEDDYIAGQTLYFKQHMGRKRLEHAITWIALGLGLFVISGVQPVSNFSRVVFVAMGGWCLYCGLAHLFPQLYLRKQYRRSGLSGKKYQADIDAEGLLVKGDVCEWRVKWSGVTVKGENESVFMFQGANTTFIFGKKYLSEEQQTELAQMIDVSGH
jgi:hypothetical protein